MVCRILSTMVNRNKLEDCPLSCLNPKNDRSLSWYAMENLRNCTREEFFISKYYPKIREIVCQSQAGYAFPEWLNIIINMLIMHTRDYSCYLQQKLHRLRLKFTGAKTNNPRSIMLSMEIFQVWSWYLIS